MNNKKKDKDKALEMNELIVEAIQQYIQDNKIIKDKDKNNYYYINQGQFCSYDTKLFDYWFVNQYKEFGVEPGRYSTTEANFGNLFLKMVPQVDMNTIDYYKKIKFINGVFNLETKKFIENSQEIAVVSFPFAFDLQVKEEIVDTFIDILTKHLNKEIVRALLGQIIDIKSGNKFATIFYGPTEKGKSTIINFITQCTIFNQMLSIDQVNNDNAVLGSDKSLINYDHEISQDKEFGNTNLKKFISNQPIAARKLYKDVESITPIGICLWASNMSPKFKGTKLNDGISTRFLILKWKGFKNDEHNIYKTWLNKDFKPTLTQQQAFIMKCINYFIILNTEGPCRYQDQVIKQPLNKIKDIIINSNSLEKYFHTRLEIEGKALQQCTYGDYGKFTFENGFYNKQSIVNFEEIKEEWAERTAITNKGEKNERK